MINDVTKFNRGVKKWLYKLDNEALIKAQRKIAMDLLRKIVKYTPVDTGRARGNWQVTIAAPAEGEVKKEKNRGPVNARGRAVLNGLDKPFQIVYLTNNVPYIVNLENGHSQNSPNGMVRLSMSEVLEELK